MHRFVLGVVLSTLIFAIAVRISGGQIATANFKAKEIRQGDNIDMDISVDRAPSVDGTIYVHVGPDGDTDELILNCGLGKDATKCQASGRVPVDAKLGKWTIRKISFQTLAPAPEKELAKNGDLSFQVVPHGILTLPDSATVSDIK